jgi:hypothetical protein
MPPGVLQSISHSRTKRCNFVGEGKHIENKPNVMRNNNNINVGMDPSKMEPDTLIRKVGHEVGKIIEGVLV